MSAIIAPVRHGGTDWQDAVALRQAVLRTPLGLVFDPADLMAETAQVHLLLRVGGAAAGTVAIVPPAAGAAEAKIRQMAVAPEWAGRGFGRMLLRAAERAAGSAGATAARLHARCSAEGFYRHLGWRSEGPRFLEVGLPHVLMRRDLAGFRNSPGTVATVS